MQERPQKLKSYRGEKWVGNGVATPLPLQESIRDMPSEKDASISGFIISF